MAILRDIVEVLRRIRLGMRGLEEAINGCYALEESEGEEVGDMELMEELVELSENTMPSGG
jgi:hypothetical protein